MKNNLFYYATSELSQDAFICWLLSFAIKGCNKNPELTECAKDFLRFFISATNDEDVYLSTAPKRQYNATYEDKKGNIDVLVTLNDKYKIIIEDKTFSSEHDNQLLRYKHKVERDFPNHKVIGIYFKTGFQSDLSKVKEAKYNICDRKTIIKLLEKHTDKIKNDIFQDYYLNLKNFNDTTLSFKEKQIDKWEWQQINGFYEYFQEEGNKTKYKMSFGKVHNQQGGFYALWLADRKPISYKDNELELYLQCEFINNKFLICFRAKNCSENGHVGKEIRDKLIWKQKDEKGINILTANNFNQSKLHRGKTVRLGIFSKIPTNYENAIKYIEDALICFENVVIEIEDNLKE